MATYNVKFRVRYAGGTGDEWSEALSQDKYNWYCDGGQGDRRMKAMVSPGLPVLVRVSASLPTPR